FLFISLEILSFWLIISTNNYHNTTFLNSANRYVGNLLLVTRNVNSYFHLSQVNQDLQEENARLNTRLRELEQQSSEWSALVQQDAIPFKQYEYIPALVVNNSLYRANNYITINRGKQHGIEPGMGVITSKGVVGKVTACNDHFSTVISVLHTDLLVSAQLKKNGELGTVKWDGRSPRYAKMTDVPSYLKVAKGDSVISSGYNATFPPQTLIGTIGRIKKEEQDTFHNIDVLLSTNFGRLKFVYVVKNILKESQETLEIESYQEIDE
ncbi:MAG: rod shape-determining protein MreC, partial [Bacteroidota bacterium]